MLSPRKLGVVVTGSCSNAQGKATGSWRPAVRPDLYSYLLHGSRFSVYLHDLSIPILLYSPVSWKQYWQDPVPMASQDPVFRGGSGLIHFGSPSGHRENLPMLKTKHTGTIPFMALQRLASKRIVHIFRHDGESFIWLFLWVCGCSDGSKREVPVAPYNGWRKRDLLACKIARGAFLSKVNLEDINVSEHHAENALFCLFLAKLLQQLCAEKWDGILMSMNHSAKEKKDMVLFQALLPKFWEVQAELNRRFLPKDWFDDDDKLRPEVRRYIRTTVAMIIDGDFS